MSGVTPASDRSAQSSDLPAEDVRPDLDRFLADYSSEPEAEAAAAARSAARADRRRAARKRLWRQRLIALGIAAAAVLIVLILGFAWPAWFLGAGGSAAGGASGSGSPTPTASKSSGKPSAGASSSAHAGANSGSGSIVDYENPKPLRTPTVELPLRLKMYGDSVGGDLAWAMAVKMGQHPKIKYWKFSKPCTGLVRPDYFSWPNHFREDLAHHSYGAVIFMSGANDGQGMTLNGHAVAFGSATWLKEYHRRVGAAMDLFLARRVKRVYWVGMPEMGDPEFSALMVTLNKVSRAEAEKRAPYVRYVDAWQILDGANGAYVASYRQPDGVHLGDSGSFKLAEAMYDIIEREWHITGTGTEAGTSPGTGTSSSASP